MIANCWWLHFSVMTVRLPRMRQKLKKTFIWYSEWRRNDGEHCVCVLTFFQPSDCLCMWQMWSPTLAVAVGKLWGRAVGREELKFPFATMLEAFLSFCFRWVGFFLYSHNSGITFFTQRRISRYIGDTTLVFHRNNTTNLVQCGLQSPTWRTQCPTIRVKF